MLRQIRRPVRLVIGVMLLALTACGTPADTQTIGVPTSAAATATNTPTADLQATATLPPTPLPAPVIIATEPSAEQPAGSNPTEPAVVPTSAHPIADIYGIGGFNADVNPLTGLTIGDANRLARRPLAVKISNYPPIVRPQAGLNSADLIFEHYAEGGVTRFTALFYGNDAATVGSIRSGRLIDLEIPNMYDAGFAYSGSSGPVQEFIRNSIFFDRVISPDFGHDGFFRVEDPNKPFEHTLFTGTDRLRFQLENRGQNVAPSYPVNMTFSQTAPAGTPATSIELRYRATNAFWQYNPDSGRYTRWSDGVMHSDANTGEQVNFRNVIVLGAHHEDTLILEDFVNGGSYSVEIQVWGEGPVSIFRDGIRIDGRWVRNDPGHMLTFYDMNGDELPLAPGNSFIQVVPLGFDGLITN